MKKKNFYFYLIGILLLCLYYLPYFINGDNAYFRIHDYLEQDFVNIKLNAKYLFNPAIFEIPELFNGTFRASIQGHSFLQVVLYKFVQGSLFLNINQFWMAFLGYTGMYLLVDKVYQSEDKDWIFYCINCGAAFLIAIIPLLLHGATALSLPLFLFLTLLLKDRIVKSSIALGLGIAAILGLSTSLIYGGFLYLLILFVIGCSFLIKKSYSNLLLTLSTFSMLTFCYLISNFYMFAALKEQSHRLEWVSTARPFLGELKNLLLSGNGEIHSFHILALFLLCIVAVAVFIRKDFQEQSIKSITYSLAAVIAISIFAAFFKTDFAISLRQYFGGTLRTIQFDRISYFLAPLWGFIFASTLVYICKIAKLLKFNYKQILSFIFIISVFITQYLTVRNDKDKNFYYKCNTKKLAGKEVPYLSYKEFFDVETMAEIKNYINKPQNEYRVVSYGINPAVALYSGFYCLDGYLTNYRLSYKHEFAKVIKETLDNNKTAGSYYARWGSRVYLISTNFDFRGPTGKISEDLGINFDALKNLHCNYILSAFEIQKYEKFLKLEKIFTSKNRKGSYIYLYSLN